MTCEPDEAYAEDMRRQDRAYIRAVCHYHPELAPPEPEIILEKEDFDADPYPAPPLAIHADMLMSEVASLVAAKHRIAVACLINHNRHKRFVAARHETYWLCFYKLGKSYAAIGRAFKRDHTSVLHGVRRHNQKLLAECNNS